MKNGLLITGFAMIGYGIFRSFQAKNSLEPATESQKNVNGASIVLGLVLLGATTLTNIPSK